MKHFISCPVYESKNPDFPVRVTQRALDQWTKGWNYLAIFRTYKMIHVHWNPETRSPEASEEETFQLFTETYEKIKGLRISIVKKEADLLQGAILDYYNWPLLGDGGDVWMPPDPTQGVASNPGHLSLSLERLSEIHPELTGAPPSFWQSLFGRGTREGQGFVRDVISRSLWLGDTRAAMVMQCRPLIIACYIGDFRNVVLLRFDEHFAEKAAERLRLQVGNRLVATHTFWSAGKLASDLNTPQNPIDNPWRNASSYIGEFLSDDNERLQELHDSISEDEWNLCGALGRKRMQDNVPCREGRPWLSYLSHDLKEKAPYPYGAYVPATYT